MSPHNADRVYLGGNRLFISDDRGDSWRVTDDLTRALDQDSLPIMGMLPDSTTLSKHDGTSGYGEITAISESPVTAGILWSGADDGTVQVSRDDGHGWMDVTANITATTGGPPFPYYVSWVEASHDEAERAYVSLDGHWDDDYAPYVFVTEDLGASWRSISGGLGSATVNVVREHHANPNVLIVGAEDGAFASIDRGATWGHLGSGMPAVPVDDIEIHPRDNDVVAGTHGRGIYILDDIGLITPYLHIETDQVAGRITSADEPLFTPPRPATLFLYRNDFPSHGQGIYRAANPPYGANFDYWLPDPVEDGAHIEIRDASGTLVRTLTGPGAAGLNRVTWDLRHDPIPHDTTRFDVPNLDSGPDGPFVMPGEFGIVLEVGDERRSQDLTVRPDDRLAVTAEERQARYDFTMELRDLQLFAYEKGVAAYDMERCMSDLVEALAEVEENRSGGPGARREERCRDRRDCRRVAPPERRHPQLVDGTSGQVRRGPVDDRLADRAVGRPTASDGEDLGRGEGRGGETQHGSMWFRRLNHVLEGLGRHPARSNSHSCTYSTSSASVTRPST